MLHHSQIKISLGSMVFFKVNFLFLGFSMQMRNFVKNNESAPEGFMCLGGWQVLVDYYQGLQKK